MKFCYADESVQGHDLTVIVGIVVDASRMHLTKADWKELLNDLDNISDGRVTELKGRELYRGNDYWRQLDGGERAELIDWIIQWMGDRKHAVTFGAVSKTKLAAESTSMDLENLPDANEWSIAAMHLLLGIQKQYQRMKNNKGNTVFVFDKYPKTEELLGLVLNPPSATDGFYNRKKKQRPLDQIVDVPYFVDSRHVGLIQVADLFAFLLCLYASLVDGSTNEKFKGELQQLEGWVTQLASVFLPDSARWPQSSQDPCSRFFRAIAPPSLLKVAPRPPCQAQ